MVLPLKPALVKLFKHRNLSDRRQIPERERAGGEPRVLEEILGVVGKGQGFGMAEA